MVCFLFFFFNDTATTEIYTLSLHDALPIFRLPARWSCPRAQQAGRSQAEHEIGRSEEHTSELQSHLNLVCRLLLEKKKQPHSRLQDGPPSTALTGPHNCPRV